MIEDATQHTQKLEKKIKRRFIYYTIINQIKQLKQIKQ
jgi:hypothetical protein